MKSSASLISTLFCILTLTACGKTENDRMNNTSPNQRETYSYHFKETINNRKCDAGEITASNLTEYCIALKSDELNRDRDDRYPTYRGPVCATKIRRETFEERCKPSGYSWPSATPTPIPTATPIIVPTPRPTATPLPTSTPYPTATPYPGSIEALTLEFAKHGIELNVLSAPYPDPLPGDLYFPDQLYYFLPVLEENKGLFFARADLLKEVNITTYTSYRSAYQHLSIGAALQGDDLIGYFKLFDRKLLLEKKSGLRFDFGVEVSSHDLSTHSETLSFFEKQDYRPFYGMVKKIKLETINYYSAKTGELSLNHENYSPSFLAFMKANSVLFQTLVPLQKSRIRIEFGTSFDFFQDTPALQSLGNDLTSAQNSLMQLSSMGFLQQLILAKGNDNHTYFPDTKCLTLFTSAKTSILNMVTAIHETISISNNVKIKLSLPTELDHDFLIFSDRLKAVQNLLYYKNSKIKLITFTNRSKFEYNTLYIGTEDTIADLMKVMGTI